ncbi:hypothetical protein DFH28DRAFT_922815 [Melampsora americana]|nr:hypothetical protein DFH28DRAFT_922815 [Melampsora americana]
MVSPKLQIEPIRDRRDRNDIEDMSSIIPLMADLRVTSSATCSNPPPWQTDTRIRWCIVSPSKDHSIPPHAIQGTQHPSSASLLDYQPAEHEVVSCHYVFVVQPDNQMMRRVIKQIVFQNSSYFKVGFAAYDADVLDPNMANSEQWIEYELFTMGG